MKWAAGIASAVIVTLLVMFAVPIGLVGMALISVSFGGVGESEDGGCSGEGSPVTVLPAAELPPQLGSWSQEQLTNAATIVTVGQQRGIPLRGQTIAVMTAMGESSLINVGYGDDRNGVTNPNGQLTCSLGLFQQQWCLGWGTKEEVMNPVHASGSFYDGLLKVDGWAAMEPTLAAHAVQRNADPWHYAKWWNAAVDVVAAIAGEKGITDLLHDDNAPCAVPGDPAGVTLEGWANPAVGTLTSGFGPRNTGIPGASTYHLGQDIAAVCRTPEYAAAAGTVISAGLTSSGNVIEIDHGQGAITRYRHVLTGSILVHPGDHVTAGQQISGMGGDKALDPKGAGTSSGCHLHFEVVINGATIDPVPFMLLRGVTLGKNVVVYGPPVPTTAASTH
jgi:Peptidase family M23